MMRKIVIEIPEDEKFDWKEATSLWKTFMPSSRTGYNTVTPMIYVWYDISPKVITTPLSDALLHKCNFKGMKNQEIERLERQMYELKQKIKTLKEES